MNRLNDNILSFNDHWRFHLGVPSSGEPRRHFWKAGYTTGPAARVYNDSAWRTVTLPHDWGMELDYDYTVPVHHGGLPISGGQKREPIGFYRRDLEVPEDWRKYRAILVFDGVFRDSQLWVNGQYVTNHVAGYTGFRVDITDLLFYGEVNNITVRVDAFHQEGWFYEGAGIYRNVWLRLFPQVNVDPESVFVRFDGKNVRCSFTVRNDSPAGFTGDAAFTIAGLTASAQVSVAPWRAVDCDFTLTPEKPILWDTENPHLYPFTVSCGEHTYHSRTGLRTVRFDPDHGFFLNDRPVKILGSCTHQDFAIVGVGLSDDVQRYKMEILKKHGFNGNRTAHNPPAPEVLEACDELGLLVMSEARLYGSTPEALRQLEWTILTGRCHPSVVIWSIGNEEIVIQNSDSAARQALTVQRYLRELDPTRAITYAGNNAGHTEGINDVIEVRGVNYMNIFQDVSFLDRYHEARPTQPIIGSEDASCMATRGSRSQDREKGYVEDFDNAGPGYMLGAENLWKVCCAREYLAGVYVWTGFDYRGEASKQAYITNYGVIDLCGFPKVGALYYKTAAAAAPVMELSHHWTHDVSPGTPIPIRVHSNVDEVELFLNGVSHGRQRRPALSSLEYEVPYAPGEVLCVGYTGGVEVVRRSLHTAGAPARLAASVERIGETSFVTVEARDTDGIPCPEASSRLHFTSDAYIVGASNGNPSDEDPERCPDRWESLPLRAFRVHEAEGDYQYSDQNLDRIIGSTDPERVQCRTHDYLTEGDDVYDPAMGPRRKIARYTEPPMPKLHIACEFWMDSSDLGYETVRLGYAIGRVKLTLNGAVLFEGDGDGDAVEACLQGALKAGVNLLEIHVDALPATYQCAAGHGVELRRALPRSFSRRLFRNRCLCMVKGRGKLHITADGMEAAEVDL